MINDDYQSLLAALSNIRMSHSESHEASNLSSITSRALHGEGCPLPDQELGHNPHDTQDIQKDTCSDSTSLIENIYDMRHILYQRLLEGQIHQEHDPLIQNAPDNHQAPATQKSLEDTPQGRSQEMAASATVAPFGTRAAQAYVAGRQYVDSDTSARVLLFLARDLLSLPPTFLPQPSPLSCFRRRHLAGLPACSLTARTTIVQASQCTIQDSTQLAGAVLLLYSLVMDPTGRLLQAGIWLCGANRNTNKVGITLVSTPGPDQLTRRACRQIRLKTIKNTLEAVRRQMKEREVTGPFMDAWNTTHGPSIPGLS